MSLWGGGYHNCQYGFSPKRKIFTGVANFRCPPNPWDVIVLLYQKNTKITSFSGMVKYTFTQYPYIHGCFRRFLCIRSIFASKNCNRVASSEPPTREEPVAFFTLFTNADESYISSQLTHGESGTGSVIKRWIIVLLPGIVSFQRYSPCISMHNNQIMLCHMTTY